MRELPEKLTILVVDDLRDYAKVLKQMLQYFLKQSVIHIAESGEEGIALARRHLPDIILLDAKMPHLDGFEVCRILKNDPATEHVPILMVSGNMATPRDRAMGLDSGADGYICKPFEKEEFIAQVKALLRIKFDEDKLRDHEAKLTEELDRRTTELAASEESLRNLFDSAPDAIMVEDFKGLVLDANPAASALHGYTREKLVGMNIRDLVPQDSLSNVEDRIEQIKTGELSEFSSWLLTKDKQRIPIDITVSQILHNGEAALLLHVRDIRARIESEQKRQMAEARYQALVEQIPAVTYVFKVNNGMEPIYISPQIVSVFGISAEDWMAKPQLWQKLIHPEDRRQVLVDLRAHYKNNQSATISYRVVTPDGKTRWVETHFSWLGNANGESEYMQGVLLDMTDRKETEETLHKIQEQLRQAQKMEGIGRLAGGIAHDFNNLLTSILGFAHLIKDDVPEDLVFVRDGMDQITAAGERAAKLTQQLLAFGRKQIVRMHPIDLNESVLNTDAFLRRTIGNHIELVTLLSEDLWSIDSDESLIEQILTNLAINSKDAMPDGGKITIRTHNHILGVEDCEDLMGVKPGEFVQLSLSDSGTGIPKSIIEHIYEPYFTTKDRGKGTGLGLSTVYGIVKQCKGHIDLISEDNAGTSFKLFFPRAKKERIKLDAKIDLGKLRGTETILVAEDENTVRELTVKMLTSLGYNVLAACSGMEALQFNDDHKGPIELVIADLFMPHMSGLQLIEKLSESNSSIRVLFTSGYGQMPSSPDFKNYAFITKPYTRQNLALKIRQLLDTADAN